MKHVLFTLLALCLFASPAFAERFVSPSEDAYTPAFDSEGCVPIDAAGKVLAFGPDESQTLPELDFAPVFLKQAASDSSGKDTVTFTALSRQKESPLCYKASATVMKDGKALAMSGTLTLRKAAAFDGDGAAAYKNVATGKTVERMNTEVRNGFVSGDLVLSGGGASFRGIITAYFCWRFDWKTQKLSVAHFEWPSRFIKDFQNPYFSGEWN